MPFCPRCGQALQGWERHCPACGSALGAPAPSPARKDTGLAEVLLLVGGLLSIALPALLAVMFLFLGSLFAAFPPFGTLPAALFAAFALVFLVLGVVWAAVALYARNLVREGQLEKGGMVALVAGGLGVLTGNVFGGVLLLAGGAIAYGAKG